jgi:hypothetical protein
MFRVVLNFAKPDETSVFMVPSLAHVSLRIPQLQHCTIHKVDDLNYNAIMFWFSGTNVVATIEQVATGHRNHPNGLPYVPGCCA